MEEEADDFTLHSDEGRLVEIKTQLACENFNSFVTKLKKVMKDEESENDENYDVLITILAKNSARAKGFHLSPSENWKEDLVPNKPLSGVLA